MHLRLAYRRLHAVRLRYQDTVLRLEWAAAESALLGRFMEHVSHRLRGLVDAKVQPPRPCSPRLTPSLASIQAHVIFPDPIPIHNAQHTWTCRMRSWSWIGWRGTSTSRSARKPSSTRSSRYGPSVFLLRRGVPIF